ncbi:MAG: 50S ribosomal protein L32 [Candidatus Paceibacterota bacterium]
MSSRMRHTKSKTGRRRSHHGLKSPRLATCSNCGESHTLHTVCEECGTYRGRTVIDVEAIKQKKLERKMRKRKEMGLEAEEE